MKHNNVTDMLKEKYFYIICIFLVIATLAVYWQVLDNDFINYDDDQYVTENIHVNKGVTFDSLTWAFTSSYICHWHPLTWISHMIDCQLYGLNPGGHHLTSLLLHVANTLLLLLIFVRITGALWRSSFVAALFALHPLHVESVAWVAERKDVLSTFFLMLTVWAYIFYVKNGGVKRYLLVVLFFVFGLMSKAMLVTLPLILLMLDFWPLGRFYLIQDTRNLVTGQQANEKLDIFRLVLEKVPFFVLAVVLSIVAFIAQGQDGNIVLVKTLSIQSRIINALVAYIEYIVNMIWPVKLAVLYPHPGNSLSLWKGVVAGLVLVLITIFVIRKARKAPYLAVGWFWYVITLIPVIGIVQIGWQAKADRYTYTTLTGLFVIIAWGANDLLSKWSHRKIWLGTLAGIILPVLIVLTWKQVQYWENSITICKHTLKHTSNNFVIHNNLGNALDKQDRAEEAIEHFLQALRVNPDHVNAHINLGVALGKQGQTEEAIEHYLQALRIRPDYAEVHNNLGVALGKQGRTAEAIEHFLQALRVNPDYTEAHNNLGVVLDKQDRAEEAIEHFLQALRIKPDYVEVHNHLGTALARQGRTEEAIEHFLQALRLKPDYVEAHNNLGVALYKQNRTDEAIEHYLHALRIKPDYVEVHNNLGTALVRKGHIKEAIALFREALRVNPDHVNAKYNLNKVLMMQQESD